MYKGNKIYFVIATVAVLLLVSISVQVYWIYNAYQLKEASFRERVHTALKNTGKYAEEKALSFYLYGKTYLQPGEGITILKTKYAGTSHADTVRLFNEFPYKSKPETCFYSTGISYYDVLTFADVAIKFEYRGADTGLNIPEQNRLLQQLTQENYRSRLKDDRPIHEKVDLPKIDSFLKKELRSAGISSSYVYGLKRKGQKDYEYISEKSFKAGRKDELFSALLFTDKAFAMPYRLDVYLKDERVWTDKSLIGGLTGSGIIILLLTGSFIYFFRTVLRQKKLSEMKTDFINNMTHEFMTPITNIALAVETLEKKKNNIEDQKVMDVISSENAHMRENIHKILQVAVLEKGSLLLNPTLLDIHELLNRVARSFAIPLEAANGQIVFALDAQKHITIADETHIINLFYNIVDNAIKYRNEQALTIHITSGNIPKKLWVKIEDNGTGMDAYTLKHVFEKFYRGAKGDVHDVKGFGLGLTYVKSIADAHNIKIDVESKLHKGTSFTIWFDL